MHDPLWSSYAGQIIREVKGPEKDELLLRLKNKWKVEGNFWFPIDITEDESKPSHTEAFHAAYFEQRISCEPIREILAAHNIMTLFEMREEGEIWEIELDEFFPYYCGLEGFWFTAHLDWIIYASHESTITVGGEWLLAEVQAACPGWQQWVWTSPAPE